MDEPDDSIDHQAEHDAAPDDTERNNDEVAKRQRTTEQQAIAFIAAVESGVEVRAAARSCGLQLRTAYGVLARSDGDIEAIRGATLKLLQLDVLDRLSDWRAASDVGARKKGNHAPARDWLLHAGILDPLSTDGQAQVRIAINIGTDDKPMRIPSPLRQADED